MRTRTRISYVLLWDVIYLWTPRDRIFRNRLRVRPFITYEKKKQTLGFPQRPGYAGPSEGVAVV